MSLEKKKFLRLSYSCKALKLEEEEVLELDQKYGEQFAKDFAEENTYFVDTQKMTQTSAVPDHTDEEDSGAREGLSGEAVKKIHRALARATHPDIREDSEAEDFKNIQEAYESGDISSLVLKVFDLSLDITLSEKELFELEKKIENQRESVHKIKQTMKWVWAMSDKSSIMRRKIQIALGIDPRKFYNWKKNKDSQGSSDGTSSI